MNESAAFAKMKLPSQKRGPRGIFQIWITRACDKSCFGCTQGSNLAGKPGIMPVELFEQAVASMGGYFGVVALFGGNPCIHPKFPEIARLLERYVPKNRRGLWTNNLNGHGPLCREIFDPRMCNFNVHLDERAAAEFEETWPESKGHVKGLNHDCSHSPVFVAMKELDALPGGQENTEENRWDLISGCDINQKWSAMIGLFRGELRGWFCEIAGAQSMLRQTEPDYPDTGVPIEPDWWKKGWDAFGVQARKHCHECGVPLRGIGAKAVNGDREQVSPMYLPVYRPKVPGRPVEVVTRVEQLGRQVPHATDYLANYKYQPEPSDAE